MWQLHLYPYVVSCGTPPSISHLRYLQRQDKAEQEAEKQQLLASIKELAEAMIKEGGPEGPFFFGKDFSLVVRQRT